MHVSMQVPELRWALGHTQISGLINTNQPKNGNVLHTGHYQKIGGQRKRLEQLGSTLARKSSVIPPLAPSSR